MVSFNLPVDKVISAIENAVISHQRLAGAHKDTESRENMSQDIVIIMDFLDKIKSGKYGIIQLHNTAP